MTSEPYPNWLHTLVRYDRWFQPCSVCQLDPVGRAHTATFFDIDRPSDGGLCTRCMLKRSGLGHRMIQVRRNTYMDVVVAGDLAVQGVDVRDVQPYTVNGHATLFLRARAKKRTRIESMANEQRPGAEPPARCLVDHQALHSASARFCSLECKLHLLSKRSRSRSSDSAISECSGSAPAIIYKCRRKRYTPVRSRLE